MIASITAAEWLIGCALTFGPLLFMILVSWGSGGRGGGGGDDTSTRNWP